MCDVCNNEPSVGVAASGIGPFSLSWGRECLNRRAEPLWAIEAILEMNGGLVGVAEWFKQQVTYVEGRYVTVAEFVASKP